MKNIFSKFMLGSCIAGTIGIINAQKIDTKARKILNDITANYNSKKNSYFKFSFGSVVNGQVSKTKSGIYYVSGEKYKLKIMDTEQIFDGNKIYNINTDDLEVTIARPNSSNEIFSPINYLNTYRNDYNVTYNGKKTINGVNTDFIKLTPVKIKSNDIKYIYLFVDSTKKQMVKLEQHRSNKNVAVIIIKEYKENQELDPNMFVFDKKKFKNYIITEL